MFSVVAQYPFLLAVNVLFAILVFIIYRGRLDNSANYWAASALCLAVAFFFFSIRKLVPDSVGYSLPNFFAPYSLFLQAFSIQSLAYGNRRQRIWPELLCVLFACLLALLTYLDLVKFIAPLAGGFLTIVNIWVYRLVIEANKLLKNLYVKFLAYLFLCTGLIWFSRIFLSQLFDFNFLDDQRLANWLTVFALSILILFRHIAYLTIRLSLTYQSLLEFTEKSLNETISVESEKAEKAQKKAVQYETQLLSSLGALALARDNETGNHIVRTQHYVRALAERLRLEGHYKDKLSDDAIDALFRAAPLHDIGKIGIPDRILKKEGDLTDDEWTTMKTHALIGESVLGAVNIERDEDSDVVAKAILIAGGHHEKWDGTGYPRGLSGQAIPLEARIMSLADIYDALVSARVYKQAWTHEEAVLEITSKRGTQFDPKVVDAFIAVQEIFRDIANNYRDT